MQLQYDQGSIDYVLDSMGLGIDEDGYVTDDGERLTDACDEPIKADDIGMIVNFPFYDLETNESGFVVDKDGNRLNIFPSKKLTYDVLVPFTDTKGRPSGLLRGDITCIRMFGEATNHIDNDKHDVSTAT